MNDFSTMNGDSEFRSEMTIEPQEVEDNTNTADTFMKKQYQYEQISYGYSVKFRKCLFTYGNQSFLFSFNGKDVAEKVSHLVNSGLIRTKGNGIDGLARANITALLSRQLA